MGGESDFSKLLLFYVTLLRNRASSGVTLVRTPSEDVAKGMMGSR